MKETVNIAMIGVGCISGIYLKNITSLFREIRLVGVCDLIRERAQAAQETYGIEKIYDTMYDAFQDPEVDIILNLTRPYEHYEVTKAALQAGKHVYSEKPLAASLEEGRKLVELARQKDRMLGGAPDTFLGAGIQTCRKLIEDGYIGTPIGSAAFMICRGHERWHPDPDFYYQYGGGPMMDMGPYYLTAMINLMGPVRRVMAATRRTFPQRMITSEPLSGTSIDVNVSTYIAGTVEYASGAPGTIFTTFDVYYPNQARFEIYGSEGTLIVPDPNTFGGPVKLYRPEEKELRELPLVFDYKENSRGLGLADMANAVRDGRRARADYTQTFHVLEMIEGFETSGRTGAWVDIDSCYKSAPPMCKAIVPGILD